MRESPASFPRVVLMLGLLAPLPAVEALPPTQGGVAYGPDAQQRLDFWQAPGPGPTPLVISIHGGGWRHGALEPLGRDRALLDRGISVAHITYRFTPRHPLPAPVHDAARAVQFLRSKAGEWNLDAQRVVVTGFSAGGCSALWLATHDDLADPAAADPVRRFSTRVQGAVVTSAQTTIEPALVRDRIGAPALAHPMIANAGGFTDNEALFQGLATAPDTAATYREFSPITHLSPDDPPILLEYGPQAPDGQGDIHGAAFGILFHERAEALGITTCVVRIQGQGNYPGFPGGASAFIDHVLGRGLAKAPAP